MEVSRVFLCMVTSGRRDRVTIHIPSTEKVTWNWTDFPDNIPVVISVSLQILRQHLEVDLLLVVNVFG